MFGKHYESMYTGSMLGAGAPVFAVWGYVVSHQKPSRDGRYTVEVNPKLLAVVLGEPVEVVETVLRRFQEPDAGSRSKEEEGRRLVKLGEYLYWVVNGAFYAKLANDESRRAYNRMKQREHRAKKAEEGEASSRPGEEGVGLVMPELLRRDERFVAAWRKWLEHLAGKKKAATVQTQELQLKRCAEMGVERAVKMIEHSMEKGWPGLYENDERTGGKGAVKSRRNNFGERGDTADVVLRRKAERERESASAGVPGTGEPMAEENPWLAGEPP